MHAAMLNASCFRSMLFCTVQPWSALLFFNRAARMDHQPQLPGTVSFGNLTVRPIRSSSSSSGHERDKRHGSLGTQARAWPYSITAIKKKSNENSKSHWCTYTALVSGRGSYWNSLRICLSWCFVAYPNIPGHEKKNLTAAPRLTKTIPGFSGWTFTWEMVAVRSRIYGVKSTTRHYVTCACSKLLCICSYVQATHPLSAG